MLISVLIPAIAGAQFRPSKEWRTINTDIYEISVQKNGRTDIKSVSGLPLFENAYPAVRYAGDDRIEQLPVRAVYSARQEVHDKLGAGQGLALRYQQCEWQLRGYPTKPYLAVQVIYHNTRKKAVRIAELLPWCVGAPNTGAVRLGAEAAATQILQPGAVPDVVQGQARGQGHLAAYNPVSGRNLITGFLSSERAYTEVEMSRSPDAAADVFDGFLARCRYEPPVEVLPGESLASEVFYIAVGEPTPLFGLRRYGKAVAVWNGVRDARPLVPHGLSVDATDTAAVQQAMETMTTGFAMAGYRHLNLGAGWMDAAQPGMADAARFPRGMQALAADAHARGLTIGLEVNPFRVQADSALAAAHPDWLLALDAAGQALAGDGVHALDVTVPAARAHVVAGAQRIAADWGFDLLVEGGSAELLLHAEGFHAAGVTQVEAFRIGLGALREGLGTGKFLLTGGPAALSGTIADGVYLRGPNPKDIIAQAARDFYWTPSLFLAAPMGVDLPDAGQQRAYLSAAALTGGVLQLRGGDPELLRRLLPVADRPATPLDLFQADPPRIWHLPFDTPAGRWHTLGLFNWDSTREAVIEVDLRQLGFSADQFASVYDFWGQYYHGTAQGRIEVRVPPGEHRLMGLRRYPNRPMMLAVDNNLGMGAMEHTRIAWNPAVHILDGDFTAAEDTPYTFTVLVPEGWTLTTAHVNGAPVAWEMLDRTARISWTSPATAAATPWQLQFSDAASGEG